MSRILQRPQASYDFAAARAKRVADRTTGRVIAHRIPAGMLHHYLPDDAAARSISGIARSEWFDRLLN